MRVFNFDGAWLVAAPIEEKRRNSMFYNGLEIRENRYLLVQVRFPKSKRKRIRKKFKKDRDKNYGPDPKIYNCGGFFYAHPVTARRAIDLVSN